VIAIDGKQRGNVQAFKQARHAFISLGSGQGDTRQVVESALLEWRVASHRALDFEASTAVAFAVARGLDAGVAKAYDAPFPGEWHKAGMRQFPALIPVTRGDPGAVQNRATWDR